MYVYFNITILPTKFVLLSVSVWPLICCFRFLCWLFSCRSSPTSPSQASPMHWCYSALLQHLFLYILIYTYSMRIYHLKIYPLLSLSFLGFVYNSRIEIDHISTQALYYSKRSVALFSMDDVLSLSPSASIPSVLYLSFVQPLAYFRSKF